jgi:formylglycine-generating enzyme required for sulfatase activity
MKVTVLTTCALLLTGMGLVALTTRPDRVAAQSVKIEPGNKPTPKPAAPTPTPRKPAVNKTPRRAAPKIEMVLAPEGSFLMGSPENEPGRTQNEGPQHRVNVPSFYIGKYEVTQAQWRAVMGANPSRFKGGNLPVENVSWDDAKEFCRNLSQMTGEEYRLPTEAEWEYACRAETTGAIAGDFDAMTWYSLNSISRTHPVGQKQPNAFGLYDMHGNVREWCEDDWHDSYANAPNDGRAWVTWVKGTSGGSALDNFLSFGTKRRRGLKRVIRGGSWHQGPDYSRSAMRMDVEPGFRDGQVGFRLVKTPRRVVPEIEMVLVPGGSFLMGSPENEPDRLSFEGPEHRVTVRSFYLGKYEVTQAQWRAVMGANPSLFKGDNLPVETVSWDDAKEFCGRLSQMTGKKYRLPTEAEWEYACRAKTTGAYAGDLDAMAWYNKNSDGKTHPVGQKQPNAFGFYDMHGNVAEWCEDFWHEDYNGAPTDGSAWLSGGDLNLRALRSGTWFNDGGICRSAFHGRRPPGDRVGNIGFRVAVSARK